MILKYGILGSIRLITSLIYTKLFFNSSRIIRLPIDIRNKKTIDFGKNLTTGIGCRIESYPQIKNEVTIFFGENIEINDYVHISAGEKVQIGDNSLIASRVFISDINHGSYKGEDQDHPDSSPKTRKLSTNPVIIGENVWVGEGVCILPGVTIGRGSIIASSSVVTKDIPEFTIAAGIPAKAIKKFDLFDKKWKRIDQ